MLLFESKNWKNIFSIELFTFSVSQGREFLFYKPLSTRRCRICVKNSFPR